MGELWAIRVVTCVNLLVEETDVAAEMSVKVVAVGVDMLVLVEEI